MFKYSDAGKSSARYYYDKNDCTVRAYALASRMSYDAAHDRLERAGRKLGKSFPCHRLYTMEFGKPCPRPGMTVKTFVQLAAKGRFIILIRGHVFYVEDGVIFDMDPSYNVNRHIRMIWRVR
jgi:hypothetical protein